jgi:hypothetical protein
LCFFSLTLPLIYSNSQSKLEFSKLSKAGELTNDIFISFFSQFTTELPQLPIKARVFLKFAQPGEQTKDLLIIFLSQFTTDYSSSRSKLEFFKVCRG